MQKLVLVGGGGHCKACIDVIERTNQYEIHGILDSSDLAGSSVLGYNVIGTDADILKYKEQGCQFLITVGQIKTAMIRKRIFQLLEEHAAVLATVISPDAYVSKHAKIGRGTIVMHNSIVNAAAQVGENCILNTGCLIEHDSIVGHHTHVSTLAVINGGCTVGNEVFIGSNATISNQVRIGDQVVIGAGSLIIKNTGQPGIYSGSPAKRI